MITVKFLFIWLEKFGAINFHRFPTPRDDKIQNVFVFFNTIVFLVYLLFHLTNTLTRAIRYRPEFIQTLLEDWVTFFLMFGILQFRLRYRQLNQLADIMENSFSKAYPKISNRCAQKSRKVLTIFFGVVFTAVCVSFIETVLPMSESELAIRRHVYQTRYPERRLPYNLCVPGLDDTEPGVYATLYLLSAYVMFNYLFWVCLSVSTMPIMAIHIRGQYEILSKFVEMIGSEHRDKRGYRIYYTSIERNEYFIKMYTRETLGRKNTRTLKDRMEITYEREFLRQIIDFHRKLLSFRSKVSYNYLFLNTYK